MLLCIYFISYVLIILRWSYSGCLVFDVCASRTAQWHCVCYLIMVSNAVSVEPFALNGWIAGLSSLPGSGVHGVCPSSEVCVRPSEPSLWFQVAHSQLAAFVWLKHRGTLGFLKMQRLFACSVPGIICIILTTLYSMDGTLSHWWNHFILMEPFCVINIRMASEWLYYPIIQSTGTNRHCWCPPSCCLWKRGSLTILKHLWKQRANWRLFCSHTLSCTLWSYASVLYNYSYLYQWNLDCNRDDKNECIGHIYHVVTVSGLFSQAAMEMLSYLFFFPLAIVGFNYNFQTRSLCLVWW